MDETNGTTVFDRLHTASWENQHNAPEMPESRESSAEALSDDGSDSSSVGKRKDSGLRSKRGGKALQIHVFPPPDEAERRRSSSVASMVDNAPLYPLDLDDHGLDSSHDDESDRSSSFSPEVTANGFGSPIELPSREPFVTLVGRPEENGFRDSDQRERGSSVYEIPASRDFDNGAAGGLEGEYDEALLDGSVRGRGLSGRYFTIYIIKTILLILLWYALSTALTVYNKKVLGNDPSKHEKSFPAPYLMNTIHFSLQGLISMTLVRCIPSMRPQVKLSWKDYGIRVVPTALATALDIGFSNQSLRWITVSFMTMCKSSAPIFLLMFAFIFKLEVPSYKLLGIIVIISAGVLLTVPEGASFNLIGFILVMSAAVMSGFRWTVTQLLLQKEQYGLSNPFAAMSVLTPIMAAISLFLSLLLEPWRTLGDSEYFDTPLATLISFAIMLFGGALAFFMVSTEYILLTEISAVTLTVAGIVKELVVVFVAVIFLKEPLTLMKGFGFGVIIVGVSLFNLYKIQKLREGQRGHQSPDNYVPLQDTRAVYELGEDVDEDTP